MAVSDGFLEYVLDQLARWGGVSARKMFGCAGLYRDGMMFGVISNDVVYFKVDDTNREKYEAEECLPFKPFPNRPTIMSFYELPGEILENPEDLTDWAKESLEIQIQIKRKT